MSNPFVDQGVINLLRGSFSVLDFPELNVIAANMGKKMITLTFSGSASITIDTATGVVQSPQPYLKVMAKIPLLKSQSLSDQWKRRMESNALLGDCSTVPDATTLSDYQLSNCAIESVDALDFSGTNADYSVTVSGIYYINNSLWSAS
jgi:hypothetical protein